MSRKDRVGEVADGEEYDTLSFGVRCASRTSTEDGWMRS